MGETECLDWKNYFVGILESRWKAEFRKDITESAQII